MDALIIFIKPVQSLYFCGTFCLAFSSLKLSRISSLVIAIVFSIFVPRFSFLC